MNMGVSLCCTSFVQARDIYSRAYIERRDAPRLCDSCDAGWRAIHVGRSRVESSRVASRLTPCYERRFFATVEQGKKKKKPHQSRNHTPPKIHYPSMSRDLTVDHFLIMTSLSYTVWSAPMSLRIRVLKIEKNNKSMNEKSRYPPNVYQSKFSSSKLLPSLLGSFWVAFE
ncbi:hypothetical protein K505DRAFT_164239 [Melanomma pulvis-pyrius CBS 109.77]|uniref:Uncharacterized protein n=1 Tax=Melanomma pulvis-pyrius CBS 109.77 TaxID=1314802 RepID=A0A6A6WNR0_9PLEO|nr:hypothetical protein K505DRAFT_164239 [Melanomma pulvis-pyrius CBS 109.77]